jgi:hypothetical protein
VVGMRIVSWGWGLVIRWKQICIFFADVYVLKTKHRCMD